MENLVKEYKQLNNEIAEIELAAKETQQVILTKKNRVDEIRKLIAEEMTENGVVNEECDGLLFVIKSVPAKPIIQDESLLPEKYFVIKKSVDKKLVNEDFKNGIDIAGVTLDNGGTTLMVKAKS